MLGFNLPESKFIFIPWVSFIRTIHLLRLSILQSIVTYQSNLVTACETILIEARNHNSKNSDEH